MQSIITIQISFLHFLGYQQTNRSLNTASIAIAILENSQALSIRLLIGSSITGMITLIRVVARSEFLLVSRRRSARALGSKKFSGRMVRCRFLIQLSSASARLGRSSAFQLSTSRRTALVPRQYIIQKLNQNKNSNYQTYY